VATYPLGCVIEEVDNGSAVAITEVTDGMGGSNAGLKAGKSRWVGGW